MGILLLTCLLFLGMFEVFKRILVHREKMAAIQAAETMAFHGKSLPEGEDSNKVPEELVEAYQEMQREFPDRK